jgi:hypothetical protein
MVENRKRVSSIPYTRYINRKKENPNKWAGGILPKGVESNAYKIPNNGIKGSDAGWKKFNLINRSIAEWLNKNENGQVGNKNNPIKYHSGVNHALSSQVMLFNLVIPMILKGDLSPLLKALGENDSSRNNWDPTFEYSDQSILDEDKKSPTSVDLSLECGDGRILIEAKHTEREFGGCSVFKNGSCTGENHLLKDGRCIFNGKDSNTGEYEKKYVNPRKYAVLLKKILKREWQNMTLCPMASYSQFYRLVMMGIVKAEANWKLVILHDGQNPVFSTKRENATSNIIDFLKGSMKEEYSSRVVAVPSQEVIEQMKEAGFRNEANHLSARYDYTGSGKSE